MLHDVICIAKLYRIYSTISIYVQLSDNRVFVSA